MNLRTALLAAALAASACSITVPSQFSCPDPGKTTGCGAGQVCGPDRLCTSNTVQCAAGETRCSGVCTDITHNRENCGGCVADGTGVLCKPSEQCVPNSNNVPTCTPFCATGQTACAQAAGGFICENLSNDRANCGTCGNVCPQGQVCTPAGAGQPGHCAIECLPNFTNCSASCRDLQTDDAACGACGTVCSTGTHCVGGSCTVTCTPGQKDCRDPLTGIHSCVDTSKDRGNCGDCASSGSQFVCAAGQICSGGTCLVSCQAGLNICGSTCVNFTADANNCGGCGVTCGAGQVCTNHGPGSTGLCELHCPTGETACGNPAWNPGTAYFVGNQVANGGNLYQCSTAGTSATSGGPSGSTASIADGTAVWKFVSVAATGASQCVNLQSDRNDCGACNDVTNSKACGNGQVCLGGACVVSCAPGLTQCNGACVDTHNDPGNCGGCGVSCSAPTSAGPVCGSGACGVSCPAGETNCGGKCVDTSSDPNHCTTTAGSCGSAGLQGLVCVGGGCTLTCPVGSVACNGKCVDPLHDNNSCGASATCSGGVACTAGTSCAPVGSPAVGQCVATCASGFTACPGNVCKDTQNDDANCGACGHGCAAGQKCTSGVCAADCGSLTACTVGSTTVCKDTSSDPQNCGSGVSGCGHACAAGQVCSSGVCAATCGSPLTTCMPSTGPAYCANTTFDPANCGACGTSCGPYPNARAYCASSACGATCSPNFADCNNSLADGCETDLTSSAAHCASCLNSCPAADNASPACVSSTCSTTCRSGFFDCDADRSNGCEADTAHDASNCGGCGAIACGGATPYCSGGCVARASATGVQQNLALSAIEVGTEWGGPCFTESYSHVGTALAAIQAVCGGAQVMVACAAPGASTLLVAAAGPTATIFGGGTAQGATFYAPGAGIPAFGFTPAGAATSFSTFDLGGSSSDGFAGGFGSQRLSWPVQGGALTAGGRCGDRVGPSATSNYQRLVFTK